MPRSRNQTSPGRIGATKRAAQALELRAARKSFQEIADQLGYSSRQVAFDAVKRALNNTLQEPADELREIEHARLEMMQAVWFPRALDGRDKDAAVVSLKIMERTAKLLGLDAPMKFTGEIGPKMSPEEAYAMAMERIKSIAQSTVTS